MSDIIDPPATLGWLKQHLAQVLPFAIAIKADMLKSGVRDRICTCPVCGTRVYFNLAGRKDHLRMECANPDCAVRMIE